MFELAVFDVLTGVLQNTPAPTPPPAEPTWKGPAIQGAVTGFSTIAAADLTSGGLALPLFGTFLYGRS